MTHTYDDTVLCPHCSSIHLHVYNRIISDGEMETVRCVWAECQQCNYRFRLLSGDDTRSEVGCCINCGRYFDAELGVLSNVCSESCGNILTSEFNR